MNCFLHVEFGHIPAFYISISMKQYLNVSLLTSSIINGICDVNEWRFGGSALVTSPKEITERNARVWVTIDGFREVGW